MTHQTDHKSIGYKQTAILKLLYLNPVLSVMAPTGGKTGDARQASRGKTTGMQCDQERKLFRKLLVNLVNSS